MKKLTISLSMVIMMSILFMSCSNEILETTKEENLNVKMTSNNTPILELKNTDKIIATVYDQLTPQEQSNLKDAGKDAKVYRNILRKEFGRIKDESYIGKEVYLIDFPGIGNFHPNNKLVFASIEDYSIVGYGYVD